MVNDTENTSITRTATLAHVAQQPVKTTDGIYFPNGKTQVTVSILTITTKYGPVLTIHATEELARDELYEHASYWWEQQSEPENLDAFDRDKAIAAYFAEMDEEYYEIEQGTFDLADMVI